MSAKRIEPISIEFKDGTTPYSPLFGDVYYTHGTGVDESHYVYIEGSGFAEALTARSSESEFRIGEIGFGVGLNFLLTLRHFLKNAQPHQQLTYVTVEKHPVKIEDLKKLYAGWTELEEYSRPLLDQYPVLVPGMHSLTFANGRVRLILMLGDAKEMYSRLVLTESQKIQFWYWDGFAPNRNPDAFQDSLFRDLIPISTPDARATSFTSAGWVRRGLQGIGFRVDKRPGFGFKRECIQVFFPESSGSNKIQNPWFSAEKLRTLRKGDQVAVIGAGLSGTAIARQLADRGYPVILMDQDGIASHASGNTYGMFNTQLSKKPNPISRYSQLSLTHFIRELEERSTPTRKGILRLDAIRDQDDYKAAMETSEYPDDFFEFREDGLYFPECGVLNPGKLCAERSEHPLIRFEKNKVKRIIRKNYRFILESDAGNPIVETDHVIYATGSSLVLDRVIDHPLLGIIPLRPIRGQVIHVRPTPESAGISHCLVDSGYTSPVVEEISGTRTHCIGATYQAKTILDEQESIDTETLLQEGRERHSSFASLKKEDVVSSRVGYRLSTPDKMPLIGPLCDPEKLKQDYSIILRSGKAESDSALRAESGEWMITGMGSRGITFSSYGAEILASMMTGQIIPIESDLLEHIHSARFIVRNLKKPESVENKQ